MVWMLTKLRVEENFGILAELFQLNPFQISIKHYL